jgi:glycosyltransferase involved in cell wall biosynthesis
LHRSTILKIALIVHGRFHAFDLARALVARGHDVTVFTNYPAWAAARFGLPPSRVRSFTAHGIVNRVVPPALAGITESSLHVLFGRWAAREVGKESWDIIHCWSGVSEELLASARCGAGLTLLMRGSAHIATQSRLLREEAVRANVPLDRPSAWMIDRERREYALADRIVVLSSFARRSFEEEGVPAQKLSTLPLGVDVRAFRPSPEVVADRRRRMLAGEPLQVLFVGALSYQKGLFDLGRVVEALSGPSFRFTLVGPITRESAQIVHALRGKADIVGKVPQADLPRLYERSDLFLFPTIQDGYAMVLAQAKAAGLPILTTPNSAGADIITSGLDGWILPIRDARAFEERLTWCHEHRDVIAEMAQRVYATFQARDWAEVAAEFDAICQRAIANESRAAAVTS